jgi:23S rRNA pseudouridine1911/1915/1917 synthase
MASPEVYEVVADPEAGRLDRYLAGLGLPVTRSRIQRLIDEGRVTVAGRAARASLRLRGGERIRLEIAPPEHSRSEPEDLPVNLVYQDAWLAVVSKPAGLVVHPGPGHPSGTLVNALLHHCGDLSGIGGVLRPGIVHRLDKDTSGLLVIAKDDATHRALQAQFQGRHVEKVYLAVVLGSMAGEGVIDRPVGRHPVDRKKMAVDVPRSRSAVTRWRSLQELRGATLLEVRIETGRTHQIRVHLASLGHPVAGDPLYGGTRRARGIADVQARRRLGQEVGQALLAWRLAFRHPHSGAEMRFEAPLPEGFMRLIRDLGGEVPGRRSFPAQP